MKKDQLFIIKSNFDDGAGRRCFCPSSAELIGLLEIYPELKERLEIHEVDFQRPREALVSLLGPENQDCPVLLINQPPEHFPISVSVELSRGRTFFAGVKSIASYLAHVYGIAARY